jgi:hypothetical protein
MSKDIIEAMIGALEKLREEQERSKKLTAEQLALELANCLALLRRVNVGGTVGRDVQAARTRITSLLERKAS